MSSAQRRNVVKEANSLIHASAVKIMGIQKRVEMKSIIGTKGNFAIGAIGSLENVRLASDFLHQADNCASNVLRVSKPAPDLPRPAVLRLALETKFPDYSRTGPHKTGHI
jgi:hypothetical protein